MGVQFKASCPDRTLPDVPPLVFVLLGAVDVGDEVVVELPGPTRKKFPAMGVPRLTTDAKVVKLKCCLEVVALTNEEACALKVAG